MQQQLVMLLALNFARETIIVKLWIDYNTEALIE